MKELIIIGAGGMGRNLYYIATDCIGYNTEFTIKGFLDDNLNALDGFSGYPPILSSVSNYQVQENDVFTSSIGDVEQKKKCVEIIVSKGGEFYTLINKYACVRETAKIGKGCIIASYAGIGVDAVIGDFSFIQSYAVIAHDVKVGKYCRVDTKVVCVGGIIMGDEVTIHTASVINHNVNIGNRAVVAACSFVIRDVKEGTTVFGNPAKRLNY